MVGQENSAAPGLKRDHTVVINPLLISNFMKLSLRKAKTVRERERLSSQIARLKNDIEKLPSVTFPELHKAANFYSKA